MTTHLSALDRAERVTRRTLVPPPRLNVSDWLDANRVIGRGYPSPFPGPWRTSRTPYLRDVLNDFTDPAVEDLVMLFGSQIGKTEALFGMLLYGYGVDPGPGMLVLPTLELADGVSTERLAPALASCGVLAVGSTKGSRSTEDAIRHKRINGAPLTIAGSNSAASLASRPVMRLLCDEIDKWAAETQDGDPLELAKQRTAAFRRRKRVYSSTPTVKGASRIEDLHDKSDQRELFAPCPRCGRFFVVRWKKHVRWDTGQPELAYIEHTDGPVQCQHFRCGGAPPRGDDPGRIVECQMEAPGCGGRIEDRERHAMFAHAEWRPTAHFAGIRGYRTWAIVSPWLTLREIVTQWLEKKGRPETLKQFINEILGESWEPQSEKIESASLLMRREGYAATADVPKGAGVLTAGIDTQDDRLQILVMGWGRGEESWVIDYETLQGDPSKPDVWTQLDLILLKDWKREAGGTTRVQCALIDALGHRTADVYAAVVARQHRRLYASFGRDGGSQGQIVTAPKVLATKQGNVMRCTVDASQAKALIYSRLKIAEREGPGVMHFPMTVDEGFFGELTAEELRTERNKYGVPSKHWALRSGHRRNEALDCTGLALAALRIICPSPRHYDALAGKVEAVAAVVPPAATEAKPAAPAPRTRNWDGGSGGRRNW